MTINENLPNQEKPFPKSDRINIPGWIFWQLLYIFTYYNVTELKNLILMLKCSLVQLSLK